MIKTTFLFEAVEQSRQDSCLFGIFKDIVQAHVDSPPAKGVEKVLVSGQDGFATEQDRRRHGISVTPATMAALQSLPSQ